MVLGFRKSTPGFKRITTYELEDFIKKNNPVILDVRSPHEFKSGHLSNSENFDFYAQGFREDVSKLDPSKPYLVYCKNGERSLKACKQLEQMGFSQLFFLESGIESWVLNGGGMLVKE
ncbi:MAG: hypothetical protein A3H98_03240 [Bacteroidetes bacterium RIFCSPLOWO2_02_FULL_36_8]|nr:MAG: hypothetical protein A3H98_03240 [Bacteroidetes bacterium RIFCSPLOWO2_02_FULL_36_8]OFY70367.1 MAG: hypothetical protein A3G23_09570 [Bacteroidetes bacterium RIFCSPLOWO2_12_FULL_37_12]